MTIFGGRNRRDLHKISLVIQNNATYSTRWVLSQVLTGIRAAQGNYSRISVFILDDNPDDEFVPTRDISTLRTLRTDDKVWIPEVLQDINCTDAIVVCGIKANEAFSRKLRSSPIYLPILLDRVDEVPNFFSDSREFLGLIASKATTVFFNSETSRSNAEVLAPSLCERTRIFGPDNNTATDHSLVSSPILMQSVGSLTKTVNQTLHGLGEQYREMPVPPDTYVVGARKDENPFREGAFGEVRFLPGVEFVTRAPETSSDHQRVSLIDDTADPHSKAWRLQEIFDADALPLRLSSIEPTALYRGFAFGEQLPSDWFVSEVRNETSQDLATGIRQVLEPNEYVNDYIFRVVLVGRDFKFASMIVRELESASDIEFVLDHTSAGRKQSSVLAEWADVVIAEFLTPHAVWYSQNLPENTRLIVHMHGYELYKPQVHQLNINRVYKVIVPSEAYRQTVLAKMGWPEELVQVIHNGGLGHDLSREKDADARFRLGMVGWVPSLKRIDRALDLLENLVEKDSRYMLEVRGALPWNYKWEWNTPAHRDMYMEILNRLKQNPKLARSITFAPFGPDVGNWLRGIGWMLSPSVRESFHLAPVEGMLSGAVPVVWDRDGASDVYGNSWIHRGTADAASHILITNSMTEGWSTLSELAYSQALDHYDETKLREAWHKLIVIPVNDEQHRRDKVASNSVPEVSSPVEHRVLDGDFHGAWNEIQRSGNRPIHPSRERSRALEAWVRGHIRLPSLILKLQYDLNQAAKKLTRNDTKFIHVAAASFNRRVFPDIYRDSGRVLLAPPAGSKEAQSYDSKYFAAFEPLMPVVGDNKTIPTPLDEYIQNVSYELIEHAALYDAEDFLVDGPYWAVLAALHATTVTGGRVHWDLSQHREENIEFFRSSLDELTDDPIDFASTVISDQVTSVILEDLQAVPQPILEMVPINKITINYESRLALRPMSVVPVRSSTSIEDLPRTSAVVTAKKINKLLLESLDSLMSQSYPKEKLQIVVVFDQQESWNQEILERYIDQHPHIDWEISEVKGGLATARNAGLRLANGEHIIFLEAGNLLERHNLASMVAASWPNTIVVAGIKDWDSEGRVLPNQSAMYEVGSLGYMLFETAEVPDLFKTVQGRLIPRELIGKTIFSEEHFHKMDAIFMKGVVSAENTFVTAGHRMSKNSYVRRSFE